MMLARLWVVVLFSNLPIYLATFILPFAQPIHYIAPLAAGSVLAFARPAGARVEWPMLYPVSLVLYAVVCLAYYLAFGGGDPAILRQRLLGILVGILAYYCFISSAEALYAARRALVWVVLGSVAINFFDIMNPLTLVPADSEFANLGRAAGFYINANQAGAALVLGFTLSVGVVAPRWRVAYALAVVGGVIVTLSRGALLGLVMVFSLLFVEGRTLGRREVGTVFLAAVAAAYVVWRVLASELESRFGIDPTLVIDRILWILDPSGRADFSQEERVTLLERGWMQFVVSPFYGNGIGSTELWEMRTSTHNFYVMLASDFGLLGLFTLPVVLLAASGMKLLSFAYAGVALFLLFWGLLSHNILDSFPMIIAISLCAAVAAGCQRAQLDERRVRNAG